MPNRRKLWSQQDVDYLIAHYANTPTAAIAQKLNVTDARVWRKAHQLGLKKSDEYLASPYSGRLRKGSNQGGATRFKKGDTPWNKGKPFKAGGRSAETQFKAGASPLNTRGIGAYRIDTQGLLQRKINNKPGNNSVRWRGVHELVWIEHNGPRPHNHVVVFKPGMRTNKLEEITIDKVELVSRAELMRRNTVHRYPKPIVDAIRARAVLNRRINDVTKQKHR